MGGPLKKVRVSHFLNPQTFYFRICLTSNHWRKFTRGMRCSRSGENFGICWNFRLKNLDQLKFRWWFMQLIISKKRCTRFRRKKFVSLYELRDFIWFGLCFIMCIIPFWRLLLYPSAIQTFRRETPVSFGLILMTTSYRQQVFWYSRKRW